MHRAVDLLVEEDVAHVPRDARIAADPELAEPAGTVVAGEHLEQIGLVGVCGGVHHLSVLEAKTNARDLAARVQRGELREADRPLGRVLHRAAEELATGDVRAAGVDLHRAARDRQAEVGLGTDDPHLLGGVEAVGVALHALALGVPVEQARAVEELGELGRPHARFLRERRRRVLAADPGDFVAVHPLERRPVRALDRGGPLRVECRRVARVLGRVDHDQRVARLERVLLDRGGDGNPLEGRRSGPGPRREVGVERHAQQRIGVAFRDQPDELLEERAAGWRADDEHLPAGLDADARVDEQLGQLTGPSGQACAGQYKTYVLFCKVSSCRS